MSEKNNTDNHGSLLRKQSILKLYPLLIPHVIPISGPVKPKLLLNRDI
ncbi:hypothetical protein PB1E_2008 [Leuconostoc gelidum subsp. gasicomitatum]|nr:hypothetical protein PB1E_2008 [Leuconostoc gasicomitatum]